MNRRAERRWFLKAAGGVAAAWGGVSAAEVDTRRGLVVGQPEAAMAGNAALVAGGNAIDAVVTAALVAGVVALPSTGIGGYGGHLVLAGLPGNKVTAIDFNSAAPAAMKPDQFAADGVGKVAGGVNLHGWLAAGVPGVLAGLQLALDKYGTRRFADVVEPAIKLARDGFVVSKNLARAIAASKARLAADPGCSKLLLAKGEPLAEGATFRNPDLAKLLETLAERGSVASFYEGDIADKIATAFRKQGGLVTAADLAAYEAVEVEPLSVDWNGYAIHTPPLTAGGLTVIQFLSALKSIGWPGNDESATQVFVECLRVAWMDRLKFLGDPAYADVPVKKLLSKEYASETAERVRAAVQSKKPLAGKSDGLSAGGTIHLNAVDAAGLSAALTFTHGDAFGAQICVDGLGLMLGHGISRFDPRAGRPNSPGPGKRPLTNMCPTVVTKDDSPLLALGATGGRRIVNALANVLARRVGEGKSLAEAVSAPRIHTEGDLALSASEGFPTDGLKAVGYRITAGSVATLSAIECGPQPGELRSAIR